MVNKNEVSLNNIVLIEPMFTIYYKKRKYGIVGYNREVVVWIWNILAHFHVKLTMNILKLLESSLSIYFTIYHL